MVPGTDSNKYTNIDDEFMTNYVEAEGAIFEERDNRIRIVCILPLHPWNKTTKTSIGADKCT